MIKLLTTLTLATILAGCSTVQPKPVPVELTDAELLVHRCEELQGEKCYIAALSAPMINRIQEAVKYYDEHYGEKWL